MAEWVEVRTVRAWCQHCGLFYWVEDGRRHWCPYGCLDPVLATPEGQLRRLRDYLTEHNLVSRGHAHYLVDWVIELLGELVRRRSAGGTSDG